MRISNRPKTTNSYLRKGTPSTLSPKMKDKIQRMQNKRQRPLSVFKLDQYFSEKSGFKKSNFSKSEISKIASERQETIKREGRWFKSVVDIQNEVQSALIRHKTELKRQQIEDSKKVKIVVDKMNPGWLKFNNDDKR